MVKKVFGNRVTEKDIRNWLDENGFFGNSAQLHDLELHALKRPGWLQVFRFDVLAKRREDEQGEDEDENSAAGDLKNGGFSKPDLDSGESDFRDEHPSKLSSQWCELFGVVRDDERIKRRELRTQVCVFESTSERQSKLDEMSVGLITCETGQTGSLIGVAMVVGVVLLVGALAATFF
jgi:hypothetical protein